MSLRCIPRRGDRLPQSLRAVIPPLGPEPAPIPSEPSPLPPQPAPVPTPYPDPPMPDDRGSYRYGDVARKLDDVDR